MKKYVAEGMGTMFLVLLGSGSAVLGPGANGSIGALCWRTIANTDKNSIQ